MEALVLDGKVVDVAPQIFPVADGMVWVACPDDCVPGWTFADGELSPPPGPPERTLEVALAEKLQALAAHRYNIEIGGMDVNGVTVDTTDRSKTLLTAARIRADLAIKNGSPYELKYKSPAGFITINAPTIVAITDQMEVFVQTCFNIEALHDAEIRSLETIEEIDAYDFTTGWPS